MNVRLYVIIEIRLINDMFIMINYWLINILYVLMVRWDGLVWNGIIFYFVDFVGYLWLILLLIKKKLIIMW